MRLIGDIPSHCIYLLSLRLLFENRKPVPDEWQKILYVKETNWSPSVSLVKPECELQFRIEKVSGGWLVAVVGGCGRLWAVAAAHTHHGHNTL